MGHIYLYTGDAGGKTTNALGITLRSLGHGKKVYVMQLLKWKKDTGEMLFKHKNYKINQWGREGWIGLNNLTNEDQNCATAAMIMLEWIADNWGKKIFHPDLIILDEINLACYCRLIQEKELFRIITKFPSGVNWVFTGRNATAKLIKKADVVNSVDEIKAPKDMICEEGIQY